jgi:hypothetical protein
MKVREVDPNVDSGALLAGAEFIDAYSIVIDNAALDARRAAEKMLARGNLSSAERIVQPPCRGL